MQLREMCGCRLQRLWLPSLLVSYPYCLGIATNNSSRLWRLEFLGGGGGHVGEDGDAPPWTAEVPPNRTGGCHIASSHSPRGAAIPSEVGFRAGSCTSS